MCMLNYDNIYFITNCIFQMYQISKWKFCISSVLQKQEVQANGIRGFLTVGEKCIGWLQLQFLER